MPGLIFSTNVTEHALGSLLENLMRGPVAPKASPLTDFIFFCLVTLGAGLAALGLAGTLVALRTGLADGAMQIGAGLVMLAPAYLCYRRMAFTSFVSHHIALPRFAVVILASALVLLAIARLAQVWFDISPVTAAMLAVLPVLLAGFAALRTWVFAER